MREAVIVDAVRTPIGKGRATGTLAGVHPVDLLARPLGALIERTGLDPSELDDVIGGCVTPAGEQAVNVTRRAVLAAGFPERVPAVTIDRQCGSSQQAVHFAAQAILSGTQDVVIACGVESMGRVPMFASIGGADIVGEALAKRYPTLIPQGISAELIAARWRLGRGDLDAFSLRSQELAAAARDAGRFSSEIVPIEVVGADGKRVRVNTDEGIRKTSLEALAGLAPAFRAAPYTDRYPELEWMITAGSASQISDGASAVLMMSGEKAKSLGLRPRARIHSLAVEGDDPVMMLTAIIPATQKLLSRAGLSIDDIDLFEVNEAFASVVLAWARETGADLSRVNVNGGAIALGHPLGASGARLMTTLVNALEQRGGRYGLQVMCEAGGLANATLIESLG